MIIVGINRSPHNASVALMKDNEIIFHIENERLSNIKYDGFIFQSIQLIKNYVDHVDVVALSGISETQEFDAYRGFDVYSAAILSLGKSFYENEFRLYDFWQGHHQMHAATAFYNSGFDEALCIVKDGAGSEIYLDDQGFGGTRNGRETTTSFIFSYPHNVYIVDKQISVPFKIPEDKYEIEKNIFLINSHSEGTVYERVAEDFGFTIHDAGKIMGMAAYGKDDDIFPEIYDKNNLFNKKIFDFTNEELSSYSFKLTIPNNFQHKANFAYKLQKSVQENVAEYVLEMIKKSDQKNVCLSGGFFLNCVSNYNLLKSLPKDINLYVEPISSDAGTAIGAAKSAYYLETENKNKKIQKNIYYGPKHKISLDDVADLKHTCVGPEDVAKIIADKKIVAIYQGRSESGPRALGNRSILFDPRDPEGKDRVNKVKRREEFRPFAGSVLLENASEWFDLCSLEQSPFMMFAVDVLPEKRKFIPAITHVDGSCRVQTVDEENNKNFYSLIKEFYKLTGVPILFNTSFNLAGDCIVETLDDALRTLYNSDIDYLYLPELGVIIE